MLITGYQHYKLNIIAAFCRAHFVWKEENNYVFISYLSTGRYISHRFMLI